MTPSELEQQPTPTHASEYACVDLVNSSFADHLGGGAHVDRLATNEWQEWFLDRHGLRPTAGSPPLEDLVALRRHLRRILEKWSRCEALGPQDVRMLDDRIRRAPTRPRVTATSTGLDLRQEPLRRDWTWVMAGITGSAVQLLRTGDPQRLKTCGNPDCTWMFYDGTNNRSKQFCSTTPCGVLMRVRRFREEH